MAWIIGYNAIDLPCLISINNTAGGSLNDPRSITLESWQATILLTTLDIPSLNHINMVDSFLNIESKTINSLCVLNELSLDVSSVLYRHIQVQHICSIFYQRMSQLQKE